MRIEQPVFNQVPVIGRERIGDYLEADHYMRVMEILRRMTDHFTQTAESSDYARHAFDERTQEYRRSVRGGAKPAPEEMDDTRNALGLHEQDIRELLEIGNAFTARYNAVHRTHLSHKEGRALLLEMTGVRTMKGRSEAEGERRQEDLRRKEITRELSRHEVGSVQQEKLFRRLDSRSRAFLERMGAREGYAECQKDILSIYFKTQDKQLELLRIDFNLEPPVVAGRVLHDPEIFVEEINRLRILNLGRTAPNMAGEPIPEQPEWKLIKNSMFWALRAGADEAMEMPSDAARN